MKYFSTIEEKFRISARPCNILYNLYAFTSLSFMLEISSAELICLQNLLNNTFQKGLVDGLVTDFSNLGRQQEMSDSIRFHFHS